jgi:2-phospho-L-lactate/phosphoenolpyruvate guanylyltransferase
MQDGTYAVIPVKPFASAKRRLAPILNPIERARLARLMLEDVIDAIWAAGAVRDVYIVTPHEDAACVARSAGAEVIAEAGASGVAQAVATAQRKLASLASALMVIPSDIPHLPPATVADVHASTPERGIVLVPATYDGGTNLLAMRPVNLIPPLFGPSSFDRHRQAGLRAGASVVTHRCPMAGRDLDRPEDLLALLSVKTRSRAQDYLGGLDIVGRLRAVSSQPVAAYAPAPA